MSNDSHGPPSSNETFPIGGTRTGGGHWNVGETTIIANGVHYTPDQWRQQVMLETLQRIEKLLQALVAKA